MAFCLALVVQAQRSKRDIVYLKNGSIIRGTIVLQDPGVLVRIRTADNSLWVFRQAEIDSITHPVMVVAPPKNGYYNLTELGILAGSYSNATRAPLSLMNISSWYFPAGYSLGAGIGVEFSNESYMPVVTDLRYHFAYKQSYPFAGLQAGYSVPLGGSYSETIYAIDDRRMSPVIWSGPVPAWVSQSVHARGGFLLNPFVGIRTPLNESLGLTLSAGYRIMRYSYSRTDNYQLDVDFNRLSLKIGLIFK